LCCTLVLAAFREAPPSPPRLSAAHVVAPRDEGVRRLGEAVAADGELLVIAAPTDGDDALDPGLVEIHRAAWDARGSLTVLLEQSLRSRSPGSGDHFGACVAATRACAGAGGRDLVAVGADRALARGEGSAVSGAVEVFEYGAAGPARWDAVARLVPQEPESGASFGAAVAFDRAGSARLVVGAPRADAVGAFDAGRVHVFRRLEQPAPDPGTPPVVAWREVAAIDPPSPGMSAWFGSTVAMEGDLVAIASPGDDVAPSARAKPIHSAGAVYLYRRVAESSLRERYTLERVIVSDSPEPSAWFGLALDLDAGVLAIGAPRARGPAPGATVVGCAYLVDLAQQDGAPKRLDPPGAAAVYGFGQSLALRDGVLVIGAPSADLPPDADAAAVEDAGASWAYSLARGEYTAELRGPRPMPSAFFGASCAICAPRAARLDQPVTDTAAQGAATERRSARAAAATPGLIAIVGHRYAEEESTAPSPGAALYLLPSHPPRAWATASRTSACDRAPP
jgi:hypothetical protein